jgi:hypothetical protein
MRSDVIVVLLPAHDGERFAILRRSAVPIGPYLWSRSLDDFRATFARFFEDAVPLTEEQLRAELARHGMPGDDVEDQIDRARLYAAGDTGFRWERTTAIGFRNEHGQEVVLKTAAAGNIPGQRVYVLRCCACGHEYGANGSDIHSRRCPHCQDGPPALPIAPST